MGECSHATQRPDTLDVAGGIRLCKISPKYLVSNSTSHISPFSAIAELIDNAYDPDVKATQIHIDHSIIDGQVCLVFTDDGNGLSEDQLYRMLSFGFSDKPDGEGYKAIGRYGNGFKSGSMFLGKDAIVLTKQHNTLCVGLLSQTYHERIGAETVRIPIAVFDRQTLELAEPLDQNRKNLEQILSHSIFSTYDELIDQLTMVPDFEPNRPYGTKIIIWNLRKMGSDRLELQCREDVKDIVWDDAEFYSDVSTTQCDPGLLDYSHSLRQYCSILYLRPRMKIFILGQKVQSRLVAKHLSRTAVDKYAMKGETQVTITFGFKPTRNRQDNTNDYGIMMYHKNRLIKAYEKVGYQKQAVPQAVGVVGVVEIDFLTPIHNKQDFNVDEKYHRVMNALSRKLNEYWDAKMASNSGQAEPKRETLQPDCNWVQCDECLKWRRLPDDAIVNPDEDWYCVMHPNEVIAQMGCRVPEDRLDQGEYDLNMTWTYQQEKQVAARKRKSTTVGRCQEPLSREIQPESVSKRRRVENHPQADFVNEVRRKLDELNRQTQLLIAEPASAVDDVANALHMDREENRDDDDARIVLCVRCRSWKKLPTGHRVTDRTTWDCSRHPEESQRKCDFIRFGYADATLDQGAYGVYEPNENGTRRLSSTHSANSNGRERSASVNIDSGSDNAPNENDDVDVNALYETVAALQARIAEIIKQRRMKPERNSVTCQTEQPEMVSEGTSVDEEAIQMPPCSDCTTQRNNLGDAKQKVARFLNILFNEDRSEVQPANALEELTVLLKRYMENGRRE